MSKSAKVVLAPRLLTPRLDDDLGVRFRIGEIGKRLRNAGDADAGGHHRCRIDLPFRDQPERPGEFVRRVAQHVLNVELLQNAEHRLGAVGLHADADHDDPGITGRAFKNLLDQAGHADAFEDQCWLERRCRRCYRRSSQH